MKLIQYPLAVWDVNCTHAASWRANRRFCKLKLKWMRKEECDSCEERF